jgi:hypothetical protein
LLAIHHPLALYFWSLPMSDAAGLAVSFPRNSRAPGATAHAAPLTIDAAATYRFPFVRQRWLTGAGTLVQAALMLTTGIFLLTQISSTPNLALQISIVGLLLSAGGCLLLWLSWSDFFGGLRIDADTMRARLTWKSFRITWPEISGWRVNEAAAKLPDLASVEIWLQDGGYPLIVPGGRLSVADHHALRQLLHYFAEGREVAPATVK